MQALQPMWDDGQFKAVHGVGYEGQSLSHFTGSDIFANTDLTSTGFSGLNTGWMGRHFENTHQQQYKLVNSEVLYFKVKKPIMPL